MNGPGSELVPMRWLLRPSLLLFISLALAVAAGGLIYWSPPSETRPEPRPVARGDQEIVFLYQATAASTWQRFVKAAEQLNGWRGFQVDVQRAFPPETTAVPELAVASESAIVPYMADVIEFLRSRRLRDATCAA